MSKPLAKIFMTAALCMLSVGAFGCAASPTSDPTDLTGTWSGTFSTDNALAPMGTFSFDLTENDGTHAVNGPFTGKAGVTDLSGVFTGSKANGKLSGSVSVTVPITTMLAFPDATIDGNTITGMINIADPLKAMGSFTITRQ